MEKRNYKLYVHISPSNKRYYGITREENINIRWRSGHGYKYNSHFTNAINKYGWDNIEHIVLFDNLTKEEACLLEKMYIALYNTTNSKYGYNKSYGGDSGLKVTPKTKEKLRKSKIGNLNPAKRLEVRKKISKANTGKKRSEEQKKKMSENSKKMWADPNSKVHNPMVREKIRKGNIGKKRSAESRKKMSEVNKGKTLSMQTRKKISDKLKGTKMGDDNPMKRPEVRAKVSKALTGKHPTDEAKRKMSENNARYWKGKHLTEEHRRKLSDSCKGTKKGKNNPNSKPILMFTLDDKFIRKFDCIIDALRYLDKPENSGQISKCAKGELKTTYGYKWIYEEDYIKEQKEQVI